MVTIGQFITKYNGNRVIALKWQISLSGTPHRTPLQAVMCKIEVKANAAITRNKWPFQQ